jgi:UDP-N-acetylglucosamine 2-epimerase (non-hydrolysing)
VEAGLRSRDKYQPFPEEINRRLISHLADYHFAPTPGAALNLSREGIPQEKILVTGNTVIDALFMIKRKLKRTYRRFKNIDFSKRIVFITAHRRENIGPPLVRIARAIRALTQAFSDVEVVYPVHLNPGVQKIIRRNLNSSPRVHLLPPLNYDETLYLMERSYLILSDSGGIQEEAPSLGKPVLVLREVSERPEGIRAGALKIVGTNTEKIIREASRLLRSGKAYTRMAKVRNVYGDGKAGIRIAKQIRKWLL